MSRHEVCAVSGKAAPLPEEGRRRETPGKERSSAPRERAAIAARPRGRRFCLFGGVSARSEAPLPPVRCRGCVSGLPEPEPFPLPFWREHFPHVGAFYKVLGAAVHGVASPPPSLYPVDFFLFFFFILAEGWGKRKKKKKTSSFVGCRKASWDSWPARAGKRESGRGETNLCPACLARGLRAPNGHLRAPSPSDPISHWRCGNWEGNGSGVQGTAMRASPSAVRPAGLSLCPAARGRRAGWRANNQLVPMAQRLFSASQVCRTVREQTHCPGRSGPVPGGLLWGLAGTAQHFWGWP